LVGVPRTADLRAAEDVTLLVAGVAEGREMLTRIPLVQQRIETVIARRTLQNLNPEGAPLLPGARLRSAHELDAAGIARVHEDAFRQDADPLDPISYVPPRDENVRGWRRLLERIGPRSAVLGRAVDHDVLVVETADHHVVGFVEFMPAAELQLDPARFGLLRLLAVDPGFRHRGVGGALLAAAELEMARSGRTHAVLWVVDTNTSAIGLYTAHGWERDGTGMVMVLGQRSLTEHRFSRRLPNPPAEADATQTWPGLTLGSP
jgi:ribosomal protein S18 acetylase RimI-like enzyme